MKIGVPKEIKPQENRIGLTPDSVKTLTSNGHEVLVENNGGFESGFYNNQYKSAGAKIIDKAEDIFSDSDIIVKVKEPLTNEVITGWGRMGSVFASQEFGVVPDMMTMAKATTNGVVPMGVVACKDEMYDAVMDASTMGAVELFHGYTYSGIPVSVAAALAVQDIFEKDDILNRVKGMVSYFQESIFSLKDLDSVANIRGQGLMAGIDMKLNTKPWKAGFETFKACYEAGVNFKATGDCLIIAPQFICEKKHIDEIIDKLRTGITNYQKNQKN